METTNGIPPELQNVSKTRVAVHGIGQDETLERHDPSNIIRWKHKYYF